MLIDSIQKNTRQNTKWAVKVFEQGNMQEKKKIEQRL